MAQVNSRNVEIKAKLINENDLMEKMNIARKLTGNSESETLIQRDVFFNTSCGRLKLRFEKGSTTKLIRYERSDICGPKLSEFDILEVEDGKLLEKILSKSIGKNSINNA
jgi:adenylate cyclase class IV